MDGVGQAASFGRTPPGVRELKLMYLVLTLVLTRRTPPGVRELKLLNHAPNDRELHVAPLPGCVN